MMTISFEHQYLMVFIGIKVIILSAHWEGTLSLCLFERNAKEDIHINDELVLLNYAICPAISPLGPSPAGQVLYYAYLEVKNDKQ